jgi:hypothetical protein
MIMFCYFLKVCLCISVNIDGMEKVGCAVRKGRKEATNIFHTSCGYLILMRKKSEMRMQWTNRTHSTTTH